MDWATAAVLVALIMGPVLLCSWCCWLLHEDSNTSRFIKEVLQAVGGLIKEFLEAVGAFVKVIVEASGPMFLLALVLVLLFIAFSFWDRLNFHEEIIIGIAYGGLLVLACYLRTPWRQ